MVILALGVMLVHSVILVLGVMLALGVILVHVGMLTSIHSVQNSATPL